MRINFVTVANETMASFRYHNLIPAKELEKRGHETIISTSPSIDADIYCFSKHFNYGDYWYVVGLKAKGKKTCFHVCDNHFNTEHEQYYRRMIDIVDYVVCSTEELASLIKIETGREASVIPDPYEFDEVKPEFNPDGVLKLAWFGHPSNLKSLLNIWNDLNSSLIIVTAPEVQGKIKADGKDVPIVPYSKENLLKVLEMCDAVIIPSEMGEKQLVKSPNRLIEAVRRGKYVLADEIPSYVPFSDMWVGDIKKGLDFLRMQTSDAIETKIKQTQEYIRKNHSPELIGRLWEESIGGLC